MQTREDVLGTLKYLYSGVSNIEQLTDKKQQIIAQINGLSNEISFETDRRNKGISQSKLNVNKGKNIASTVVLIIGAIVFGIAFLFTRLLLVLSAGTEIYGAKILCNLILIVVAVVVIIAFLIARGATGAIGNSITTASANAVPDAENKIANYNNQIENLIVMLPQIDSQIAVAYSGIEDLVRSFPRDYCYSEAIERFIFYISNLRADSLKEAINMYEDEVYKEKMLTEQKKQTGYAKISAAANVQTAYNTGRIADYTKDIAGSARDIANSNRVIAANSDAIRDYAQATAANTGRTARNAAEFNKNFGIKDY